jgi:hypothetical protein
VCTVYAVVGRGGCLSYVRRCWCALEFLVIARARPAAANKYIPKYLLVL